MASPSRCECEHIDHDDGPGHKYGAAFLCLTAVKTDYGTFAMCDDCRRAGHGFPSREVN